MEWISERQKKDGQAGGQIDNNIEKQQIWHVVSGWQMKDKMTNDRWRKTVRRVLDAGGQGRQIDNIEKQ